MNEKERKVRDYWVGRFSSHLLEKKDLFQEAWIVYLRCQRGFDSEKSSFHTYYANCLRNHFINLYNKRVKNLQFVGLTLDDPLEDGGCVVDNQPSDRWSPEEKVVWDSLLGYVRGRLSGLAKQVFEAKVLSNLEMLPFCRKGTLKEMTNTDLGKYLGVNRNEVKKCDFAIMRAVLLALDYSMEDIYEGAEKWGVSVSIGGN